MEKEFAATQEVIQPLKDKNKDIEVYSRFLLAIYDHFVLSFCCPLIWGCHKNKILALYHEHISNNHLDIGVGTGYFLDHCQFKSEKPNLTLLDLSDNCLLHTANRIQRYRPKAVTANIFNPLPLDGKQFDSVGMNYLIHCLPGSIEDKEIIFKHINKHLSPQAVVFGATVIGQNIELGFIAKKLMKLYNQKGIFCNSNDSLEGLSTILKANYQEVTIWLSGCIALFVARSPK